MDGFVKRKVIVIGGGAAGMPAALFAAKSGADILLLEKNEKLGKKLYITGKGRCNVTNDCDVPTFLSNVVSNPKFLTSALYGFTPADTIAMLSQLNVPTKTEHGRRVFPVSDKASDVISALSRALTDSGVRICLNTAVTKVEAADNGARVYCNGKEYDCDAVIICTGGISYSATGSTGDGYKFATSFGHSTVAPVPSLVGVRCKEKLCATLAGLALKNVGFSVFNGNKVLFSDSGELLFTHIGVSGALALSASAAINRLKDYSSCRGEIDLKPYLSLEQLDGRVLKLFEANINKNLNNVLGEIMPKSLVEPIINVAKLSPYVKLNAITKEQRNSLCKSIKCFPLTVTGLEGIETAVVTAGGVSVKDINPSTMRSKLCPSLYFAGEVLDVDALTGGYNIQIAFSTGVLAGKCAAIGK